MSDEKGQNQLNEKKGGQGKLIIFMGAVIIVLLVSVIAILLLKKPVETTPDQEVKSAGRDVVSESRVVLSEKEAENAMEELRKEVEEGMFECNMSMTWTFENGDAESADAYVANSKNNFSPIYFDVILEGTDEIIYTSPVIPVGSKLTNFKLDKHLDAGTYRAVCDYTLLKDEKSQEPTSSAGFIITINVLN